VDRKLSGGDDDRRRRGRDGRATPRAGGHARVTIQLRTGSSGGGGGVFTSLRSALRRQRNQFVCTFVYVFSSNTFYSNTHTHTQAVLFCSVL